MKRMELGPIFTVSELRSENERSGKSVSKALSDKLTKPFTKVFPTFHDLSTLQPVYTTNDISFDHSRLTDVTHVAVTSSGLIELERKGSAFADMVDWIQIDKIVNTGYLGVLFGFDIVLNPDNRQPKFSFFAAPQFKSHTEQ